VLAVDYCCSRENFVHDFPDFDFQTLFHTTQTTTMVAFLVAVCFDFALQLVELPNLK
jgi:hypothetical protein